MLILLLILLSQTNCYCWLVAFGPSGGPCRLLCAVTVFLADVWSQSLFSRVPVRCHITISYHIGFAYMMMRRYQDAIRTLSNILLYIHRTKQVFQNQPSLYDQVTAMWPFRPVSGVPDFLVDFLLCLLLCQALTQCWVLLAERSDVC